MVRKERIVLLNWIALIIPISSDSESITISYGLFDVEITTYNQKKAAAKPRRILAKLNIGTISSLHQLLYYILASNLVSHLSLPNSLTPQKSSYTIAFPSSNRI
jgi:hypothetical protein